MTVQMTSHDATFIDGPLVGNPVTKKCEILAGMYKQTKYTSPKIRS